MSDVFADYSQAEVWYSPGADRLFIFHLASFFMLPCLEREDGIKMICDHPHDVTRNELGEKHPERFKLVYIGEL